MMTSVFSLSLLIVAVFASSASQAHAESNRGGVARISIGAGMRSWTVPIRAPGDLASAAERWTLVAVKLILSEATSGIDRLL